MDTWDIGDTVGLIGRSFLWMAAVTVPVGTAAVPAIVAVTSGTAPDALSWVWWSLLFVVVTDALALLGAVLSAPFTHLLGWALQRVRSRAVHTAAHAALAGVLGAVTSSLAMAWWMSGADPSLSLGIAIAAGAAAAIATWRRIGPRRDRSVDDDTDVLADAHAVVVGR
ncbi:hypothetical protein DEJ16_13945 [Curtobacterium sp. MCJR17_055]|uniref:hypothetical protein n=1 Tax=unclassified Curtobacterium TaxID=257496 RepID=UPI000D8D0C9A|nr:MULTISPECIES: hypothetical protein [unclassified Curtobacterium]PYY33294.1 hypothetical protein DEI87_12405 [Curtobacterium sp. MCBD17_029]PYY53237.1 hypothetical protein DEJ16_13945 [Curtobacterium sp. MCJR17_055]PYY56392.1 hypothetical protein DEJ26_13185 [Curtobacterium sp. MCPF17_015]WIB35679.1 hypothetical protein DEJ15_16290 [Curtobacterium sp. MCJR17_043]